MIQRWFIAVLLTLLVFIAACAPQQTIKAQPLNVTPPRDACADVQCDKNSYCDAGSCVCEGGFKKCDDKCISSSACCAHSDCPGNKQCQNGVCVDKPVCGYYEIWDDSRKECTCDESAKFCAEQGKCIPADHCCWHTSCYDDQRCAPTTYSGTVCMKLDTKKCKNVHEGGIAQEFFFAQGDYGVRMQKVLEGPRFDLKVNNDSIRRVRINETNTVGDNTQIYVENVLIFGGNCREEPD